MRVTGSPAEGLSSYPSWAASGWEVVRPGAGAKAMRHIVERPRRRMTASQPDPKGRSLLAVAAAAGTSRDATASRVGTSLDPRPKSTGAAPRGIRGQTLEPLGKRPDMA